MPNDPVVPPVKAESDPVVAPNAKPDATPSVPPVVPAADPKKDGELEPKPKSAPEKYDLKLPEGSLLSPDRLEKISSFAKEKGLSNEDAQSLLERESQAVASHVEGEKAKVEEVVTQWVKEGEADKEIGGEAFKKNVELAKRVVDRFGTDPLRKSLSESGLGNHPELVRLLVRIGKSMSEDTLIIPGSKPTEIKRSAADTLYGSVDTNSK